MPILLVGLAFYLFFVLVFLGVSAAIVYHLVQFGFFGDATRLGTVFYVIISLVVLIPSALYILEVDWMRSIDLGIGGLL